MHNLVKWSKRSLGKTDDWSGLAVALGELRKKCMKGKGERMSNAQDLYVLMSGWSRA